MKKVYTKEELNAMKEEELQRFKKRENERRTERLKILGLTYNLEVENYQENHIKTLDNNGDKKYYTVNPYEISDEHYRQLINTHKDLIAKNTIPPIIYVCYWIGFLVMIVGLIFAGINIDDSMLLVLLFLLVGAALGIIIIALGLIIKYLHTLKTYEDLK